MSEFAAIKNQYNGPDLDGQPDSEIPGLLFGGGAEKFICGLGLETSGVNASDERNGTANEPWPKWPI